MKSVHFDQVNEFYSKSCRMDGVTTRERHQRPVVTPFTSLRSISHRAFGLAGEIGLERVSITHWPLY